MSMEYEKVRSRVDAHGRAYAGSQRHIQTYVNDFPEVLNKAIGEAFGAMFPTPSRLHWTSPLKQEGYIEYRDAAFLRALGIEEYANELSKFWPSGGPCWDALARIEANGNIVGCVMVEAKSYLDEFYANNTGAKGVSLEKIRTALKRTAEWLKVVPSGAWEHFPNPRHCLYQCANRFAHLFFLQSTLQIPVFLVNVLFTKDPRRPTSDGQWKEGLLQIHSDLGVRKLPQGYAEVFLPAIHA
jgi:hypothetical protein